MATCLLFLSLNQAAISSEIICNDLPECEHCEVVDDGAVEQPDVVLAARDVAVGAGAATASALALRVQVIVLGRALA